MATTALVGVTTGVMKPLLSKLTKLLEEDYVKLKGVRKQIQFLRDELKAMSATLEMLADAEQLDPETREWRDKLRELAYDLEDCVDAFIARVDHEPDGLSVFGWFSDKLKKLKPRHEIASQIKELKALVIEASERDKRYDLAQQKNNFISSVDPRLQALYEDIDKLVGIDAPKKHIIELLGMETNNGSSAELKVVSITGCGGLGKTTLAKQVYDTIKGQFKCAAFVSVARTPDFRKILIHIAAGVKCSINIPDDGPEELIDKLREYLNDKRYIVVIDDVWNEEDWKFIKHALPDNDLGSRIITTTRNVTIAKCYSSQVYEMETLSFDDSKRLFFTIAFGSENDSCYCHLEDVLEKILRKCDGLPLAIFTISGVLTVQPSKEEWDRVLNAIGSALAKNPGADNMAAILSMSYFDIPHHLRACLLYLSMFPENYVIEKQCLINMWIAEGFIHEKEGQTKYEIGEGYFNDLINRCMIQPINVKYGQARLCRVHDIILDYIKCKAAEENFVNFLDAAKGSKYKVRRLCVSSHNEENITLWTDEILSHVRSVAIFGQPDKFSLLPSTALRVLDLRGRRGIEDRYLESCLCDHHLASMKNLFFLRYLRLRSCSIVNLPDNIGELQHLQALDVRGNYIEELPESIRKLKQLAHLYVDSEVKFPDGVIGQIHSLEELRWYGVRSYEQVNSIQEFSKLTKVRTLKIYLDFDLANGLEGRSQAEGIQSYVGNLLSSCNLHYLICTYGHNWFGWNWNILPLALDSWHPAASCSIRKLCIQELFIYKVPNWMGSLGNLGVLELIIVCVRPEDVGILGEIPSLLFLNLCTFGGTSGRIVFPGNNGFRNLKYFSLDIISCGTSLEFEAGSMPKLEHMKLECGAHKMKCLNGDCSSLGIQQVSSLSKVEIKIRSNRVGYDGNHDETARCILRAISAAIKTLPNRPAATFKISHVCCDHFESVLREWNQEHDGLMNEWLKLWQIREEQEEEATDSETEQEYDSDENEDEEWTDEDKETREKEVAQQDDGGSSN